MRHGSGRGDSLTQLGKFAFSLAFFLPTHLSTKKKEGDGVQSVAAILFVRPCPMPCFCASSCLLSPHSRPGKGSQGTRA